MNVHVVVLFLLIFSVGTSSGQCHFGCVYNECNDAGDCTQGCKTGYQGVGCDTCTSCLSDTCSNTSYCTYGCKANVYGDKCDQPCPDQCPTCDRDYDSTGRCITCTAGYYGHACDKQCPAKCYLGSCDKVSGDCKFGCDSGYSGPMCTDCAIGYYRAGSGCTACPWYCQSCTNSSLCDTCHDGFYGSGCQQYCSPGCRSVKCARYDGTCDVCQPGYKGTHCDQCSDNYYKLPNVICTECAANCEQCSSALSCTSCSPGYYGQLCRKQCAAGCQTINCIKTDGSCQCRAGFKGLTCSLCADGKYGDNCDKDCNTIPDPSCTVACTSTCSGQRCDSKTGKCASGCIVGHHGEWCEKRCSNNCADNVGDSSCDGSSGVCKFGCNKGYFGLTCGNKCGANCITEICARETGDCIGGCKPGFKGNDCTQGRSGEVNTGVVAGATAGAVVVILLIVVIIVLVVKLRRRQGRADKDKQKTTDVVVAPAQTNVVTMSDTDYAYIRDADIASRPTGRVVARATSVGATNCQHGPTAGPNIAVALGPDIVAPGDREYWEPDGSEYEQPVETAAIPWRSDRIDAPNTASPGQDIVVREDGACMQPNSGCMHVPSSGTIGDDLTQSDNTQTDGNGGVSEKPAYDRLARDRDMSDDPRYDQLKSDYTAEGSYMYGRIGSEGAHTQGSTQPPQSVA